MVFRCIEVIISMVNCCIMFILVYEFCSNDFVIINVFIINIVGFVD